MTPTPGARLAGEMEPDLETLIDRLTESQSRIGKMCAERRGPRMSIPVDPIRDDDVFICDTIRMAKDALRRAAPPEVGSDWRKLANISKGCLENAEQEVDQLKALLREISTAIVAMKDAEGYAKSGDSKPWSAAIDQLYRADSRVRAALAPR